MNKPSNYAVMQCRLPSDNKLDYYPTPPWATRALMEQVIPEASNTIIWEPACGEGWMSRALWDYSHLTYSSDIFDYGYGAVSDFLKIEDAIRCDWVITNPPFILAEEFINKSKEVASVGCAMLVRSSFIEGQGRYARLFKDNPPTILAQFAERVPMFKHKMDLKGSTATSYCWLVWKWNEPKGCKVQWIAPCRKDLTTQADIDRQAEWNRFVEVA